MATINKGENKFYVGDSIKDPMAEITFVQNGDNRLIIDHTYVSDELRGQGIAGDLVEKVVLFAREKGKKVMPLCPYAKDKIKKTPAYQDVVE
ncbi:putative GNAT family acetyltransferase [Virgibacillus natechei]|uniref:GNAT family acetyltransferase n=1 Tax=Virgibacillus natechei TaxID=1216297 RepID=A0ABS4II72_9BACI|nr:GNAT family N-acetyltransferase [Virgibacillus natechei]MBP1970660.1 putative GNAT family acetyltransferase [Virgibacillus natechei]UZD13954.1 N-acetyltransferase [Virgibacillus natechei]